MAEKIAACTEQLIQTIKDSREYLEFQKARKKLRENPERLSAVQAFRRERYELQCSTEDIDLYNETDRLEKKYRLLTENDLIKEYLSAEDSFFRILREINWKLILELDISDTLDE